MMQLLTTILLVLGAVFLPAQEAIGQPLRQVLDSTLQCLKDSYTISNYEYGAEIDSAQNEYILSEIVEFMDSHPSFVVSLEFYSRCRNNGFSAIDYTRERADNFFELLRIYGIDTDRVTCIGRGIESTISSCPDCVCADEVDEENERIVINLQSKNLKRIRCEYKIVVNANGDVISAENVRTEEWFNAHKARLDSFVFDCKFEPSVVAEQAGKYIIEVEIDTCQNNVLIH